jgi:L-lactate dehydrogenase (cytochrome)
MLCEVLKAETETCMRLLGVEKVSGLGPQHVSSHYFKMNDSN